MNVSLPDGAKSEWIDYYNTFLAYFAQHQILIHLYKSKNQDNTDDNVTKSTFNECLKEMFNETNEQSTLEKYDAALKVISGDISVKHNCQPLSLLRFIKFKNSYTNFQPFITKLQKNFHRRVIQKSEGGIWDNINDYHTKKLWKPIINCIKNISIMILLDSILS